MMSSHAVSVEWPLCASVCLSTSLALSRWYSRQILAQLHQKQRTDSEDWSCTLGIAVYVRINFLPPQTVLLLGTGKDCTGSCR